MDRDTALDIVLAVARNYAHARRTGLQMSPGAYTVDEIDEAVLTLNTPANEAYALYEATGDERLRTVM